MRIWEVAVGHQPSLVQTCGPLHAILPGKAASRSPSNLSGHTAVLPKSPATQNWVFLIIKLWDNRCPVVVWSHTSSFFPSFAASVEARCTLGYSCGDWWSVRITAVGLAALSHHIKLRQIVLNSCLIWMLLHLFETWTGACIHKSVSGFPTIIALI